MRTQLHGIYISLIVHGMAAIFLYGVSQGITPTTKTVVLDFSLDSGGRMGEEGSATGDEIICFGLKNNYPILNY